MVPHASFQPETHAPAQVMEVLVKALSQQASLPLSTKAWLDAMRTLTGADTACLAWYESGHARIDTEVGTASSPAALADIQAAAEEAIDQGVPLCHPPMSSQDTWVTRAHRQWAQSLHGAVATLPLPGAQAPMGAVMLAWASSSAMPADIDELMASQLLPIAPLLALQRQASRTWVWHLRQALRTTWQRWRHPPDRSTRRLRGGLLLALLAVSLLPWPDRVGGQARLEGASQRVLVSPADGYIKAAHVLPGDQVKAGQVLVDLAEQDLKLERAKWLSQIAQHDNAYAAAMTRADRSEAAISLSRLEEAQAQLALTDEQLQRAQLKAPFDGVVIQGDLSQSIGAPVKQGDTLMTVASNRAYRVIVEVDERDIARVRLGQEGVMALSALPWDTLKIKVQRITPQAEAKEGHNVYEVEASLVGPPLAEARPGLMGPAKIDIGHRPPLWGWLRPLLDRARLLAWTWWG